MLVLKAVPIIFILVVVILGASGVNGNPCLNHFCHHEKLKEITQKMKEKQQSKNIAEIFLGYEDLKEIEDQFNTGLSERALNFNQCAEKYSHENLFRNLNTEEDKYIYNLSVNLFHILSYSRDKLRREQFNISLRTFTLIFKYFGQVSTYCHDKQGNEV